MFHSTLCYEILSLVRDLTEDPLWFEFEEKLNALNLTKNKTVFVFQLTLPSQCLDMSGIMMQLKKNNFYVSVKACKLSEFFKFLRLTKVTYIEMYVSRTSCSRKWFDHWDYPSLKFYPYCKHSKEFWSYHFYPGSDNEIKMITKSLCD